jgi:hypothetical protein
MATAPRSNAFPSIVAQCDCAGERVELVITALNPMGCEVAAQSPWHGDCDFLRLVIDGRIHINGRMVWRRGEKAGIRFFGQLHPIAVDELTA